MMMMTKDSFFFFSLIMLRSICIKRMTKEVIGESKGLFGWRSGKVGGWKIVGGWKYEKMENI